MEHIRLDTQYAVETPESIDLTAQLAGPIPRILAYAIDSAICMIIMAVAAVVLVFSGEAGVGVLAIILFLLLWFYPVFFEVFRNGQTPGKKRMGIMAVNDDLTPISFGTSLTRNLLLAVDFLPSGYLFGVVSMFCSTRFQRLGDLAAGSVVIHCKKEALLGTQLPEVSSQPPPIPLSLEDQVAFTSFTQRHEKISEGRKEELANIVAPLLRKNTGNTVAEVQGIGNWLLGKHE